MKAALMLFVLSVFSGSVLVSPENSMNSASVSTMKFGRKGQQIGLDACVTDDMVSLKGKNTMHKRVAAS